MKARVVLFKHSGKYYATEEWEVPTREDIVWNGGTLGDEATPFCMLYSRDFHSINGGPVLVEAQEPWGYPHLIT